MFKNEKRRHRTRVRGGPLQLINVPLQIDKRYKEADKLARGRERIDPKNLPYQPHRAPIATRPVKHLLPVIPF